MTRNNFDGSGRARLRWVSRTLTIVAAAALAASPTALANDADTIYFGGTIITIDDAHPSAEAVAVKAGRIVAVGTRAAVEKAEKGAATRMVDLGGKTMIPGFVDAHSHYVGVALQAISANLLPPPDGPVKSIAQLQQVMREFIETSPVVKQHRVAIGFNYDDSELAEHRSPTRQELDAVTTEMPVMIVHQSGHLGVYNSKALELGGITAASKNPDGGVIRREAGGNQPNGVMEENAHFELQLKSLPKFTPEQALELLAGAGAIYAKNGFTTVQEGRADPQMLALLTVGAAADKLDVDVVVYPDLAMNADNKALSGPLMSREYSHHLRLGGVKLTFDGSPQGKTAWFTEPYFKVPEGQPKDYHGYPSFKAEEAAKLVLKAYQNHWQLLVHANGDAAIDELVRTVTAAQAAVPGGDPRTVLIHGQFAREDQIASLKKLGIFPALFPMHTFYWGDWHRDSVAGPKRAEDISPTGWALAQGMKFSIHSDAPVTFPNSMRILDSAVNRTTRSGQVLGPKQRLEPIVALKAMTLWPAYQHFEETTKGSIETGKIADLVILSGNPLLVERAKLIDLEVLETIKGGKTIYEAR